MKGRDMRLFELIRSFLADYLPKRRNYSANTVRSYRTELDQFLTFVARKRNVRISEVSFSDFGKDTVCSFLEDLETSRGCSIQTRNHRLNGIRSFVSYAATMDLEVATIKLALETIPMKKTEALEGVRHLSEASVAELLGIPDGKTWKGRRDLALLSFMYDTAARVQETVGTLLSKLNLGDRPAVTLTGKGRKTRVVPLMNNTVRILSRHIREFHPKAASDPDAPLFFVVRNGIRKRMTEDNVRKLLCHYGEKLSEHAREGLGSIHPHLLRHSRAMHLYQNGMSLELLSQWLGHSQIETTLVYAHADAEMKRKAIEEATPPDSPLGKHIKPTAMKVNDDDLIRRLYGLK